MQLKRRVGASLYGLYDSDTLRRQIFLSIFFFHLPSSNGVRINSPQNVKPFADATLLFQQSLVVYAMFIIN